MSKPRLLIISSARSIGGGEMYLQSLLPEISDQFAVTVLAPRKVRLLVGKQVSTRHFPAFPRWIEQRLRRTYQLKKLYYKLFFGLYFRTHRYDIVNPQWYDEALLETLASHRTVFTLHTNFNIDRSHDAHVQQAFADVARIVCVSQTAKDELIQRGVPATKCVVIANGVAVERFTPARQPGEFVTWIGRLEQADKNPLLFAQIAQAAQKARAPHQFRFVGEGSYRPQLEAFARTNQLHNLEFAGFRAASDMPNIYTEASVLCLTSTSEGMPLTVLEAMAAGVPVVSTDVGGLREIIPSNDYGRVLSDFEPADFLAAINQLTDVKTHQAVATAARRRVEQHFSVQKSAKQLTTVYRDVLANKEGNV